MLYQHKSIIDCHQLPMSKSLIHETAIIADDADIDDNVEIGPYTVVEGDVQIGTGTVLGSHVSIRQFSRIGKNNSIDSGAVIGGHPQHTAFDGSETWVIIGNNNKMREGVTVNRAYLPGATTKVGSGCYFMAGAHVGHDCDVADNVILTNGVVLGGHVDVGRNAIMGGYAGAHQFLRVGAYSMVAGYIPLRKDALPYAIIGGEPICHYRLNTIGLRRAGIERERYRALEAAFRALRDGDKQFSNVADTDEVRHLREWVNVKSKFGYYGFAKAK